MTAARTAKAYGVKSLKALSETTGYNIDTLRRMHNDKPSRFRVMCLGSVCDELRVDGVVLRDMHDIIQRIKEG